MSAFDDSCSIYLDVKDEYASSYYEYMADLIDGSIDKYRIHGSILEVSVCQNPDKEDRKMYPDLLEVEWDPNKHGDATVKSSVEKLARGLNGIASRMMLTSKFDDLDDEFHPEK